MAVWSEVYISDLYQSQRLDAEFYKPEYLELQQRLGSHNRRRLGELTERIDVGHVGPMTSQYVEEESLYSRLGTSDRSS